MFAYMPPYFLINFVQNFLMVVSFCHDQTNPPILRYLFYTHQSERAQNNRIDLRKSLNFPHHPMRKNKIQGDNNIWFFFFALRIFILFWDCVFFVCMLTKIAPTRQLTLRGAENCGRAFNKERHRTIYIYFYILAYQYKINIGQTYINVSVFMSFTIFEWSYTGVVYHHIKFTELSHGGILWHNCSTISVVIYKGFATQYS